MTTAASVREGFLANGVPWSKRHLCTGGRPGAQGRFLEAVNQSYPRDVSSSEMVMSTGFGWLAKADCAEGLVPAGDGCFPPYLLAGPEDLLPLTLGLAVIAIGLASLLWRGRD
jgi:hypothetical protein